MTAALGGAPNPGDKSLESTNSFNKRSGVPTTESKGITVPNGSKPLVGPPNDPPTGVWPKTNFRRAPKGDANAVPNYLVDTGWTTHVRHTVVED